MAAARKPHEAALDALIPAEERHEHDQRVQSLLAKNRLLEAVEEARSSRELSKSQLAGLAGLEASSVRRTLTAETANPTTENVLRLLAAADARLEVVLPSGDRRTIV